MTDSQDTTPESPQGVDRKAEAGCPVMHDSATAQGSESENPVIDSPQPATNRRPHTNQDWWPNSLDLSPLRTHSSKSNPLGPDFDYSEEFKKLDLAELRRDVVDVLNTSPGLVARRLRPLRRPVHPDELARGRHLPDLRRPRRRRRGLAALRPAQQLARQRQPRQGPPPALAGQAEARPEDLVGRPDGLRRHRGDGGHGLPDLRLRLRARGHLGARGDLLGPRGHLARRRALRRRARARGDARRGPDGPDLRQPRGPQRQPRPGRAPRATSATRSRGWR